MKNYFSLDHKIIFYTPSTYAGKPIDTKTLTARTHAVAGLFSDWFGGATIETGLGYWKGKDGKFTTEKINKIVSFATAEAIEKHTKNALNLASTKCKKWRQEAIGLEIDNKFLLID